MYSARMRLFYLASFYVIVALLILMVTEPNVTIVELLFEITSAFGTCGMSLGITSDLSVTGKFIIMMLMFIGRVGLISFLFTLGGKTEKPHYHFPKEQCNYRLTNCKNTIV